MIKKIIFSRILPGVLLLVLFSSCKKRTENFLGPQYGAAPADFSVVNNKFLAYNIVKSTGFPVAAPASSVTINTRSQYYKASFSHKVGWKLTISSWKTNAVKTFSGFDDFIDSTNTKWDGGSDNDYFFGYGNSASPDTVEVRLSFAGTSLVLLDTIEVKGIKKYHDVTFIGIYHYVIDDFDGVNTLTALSSFYPDADDLGGGNNGNAGYSSIKCQDNFSYRMLGTDVNNNTYLGSCNTPTQNDIALGTFKTTDPNQLFINMYVYGFGKPNTTVSVIAYENDADQPIGTYNEKDGATSIIINDKLIYQVGVTWKGWKLVSIPYSGFKKPNTDGGKGNNRLNPERLCGLALELDSYPTSGFEVEALVDMITITENGTFQK